MTSTHGNFRRSGTVRLLNGSISRPEGESVSGHAVSGNADGEESLEALAKSIGDPDAPTTSGRAAPDRRKKIVRATMRIELDTTPELRKVLVDVAASATRVANILMRALAGRDLAVLDAFAVANGRRPQKSIEWPRVDLSAASGLNLYALGRAAAPELATGMIATIARNVEKKWGTERWDIGVREIRSPPHFKKGAPFPLRAQDFTIKDGQLDVTFLAGAGKRIKIGLKLRDARQREVLTKIVNDWKHGNAAIEQDRLRPWKWYVRVSYTRFVEERETGIIAAAHRGIRNFLVLVAETGDRWIVEGGDIEAFLKQVQRRRRSYQRQVKSSSRTGRGRARALEPIKKLEDKATRWRRTRNQTIARRAAEWLRDRGVRMLFLEDLSGIRDGEPERLEGGERVWQRVQEWPFFDLGTRLISCCEEYGIAVTILDPHYISQRCPKCAQIDVANRDLTGWRIRCTACKHSVDLDVGAAQNLLARSSDPGAIPIKKSSKLPPSAPGSSGSARKHAKKDPKSKDKPPQP